MSSAARERGVGPGRLLACCYAVFVLASGARAGVQLATHADRAPLAYALSAGAALVYAAELVLVLALDARPAPTGLRAAARWVAAGELVGVLVVGTATLAAPAAFPEATVWSRFGSGYGFVPLALPLAALVWLRHPSSPAGGSTGDGRSCGSTSRIGP